MPNYITTLEDSNNNVLIPKTQIKAIFDKDGNYLDNDLTANDLNYLKNNTGVNLVKHGDNEIGSPVSINADRLNGHPDTYFANVEGTKVKRIIVNVGTQTMNSNGYLDISSYKPSTPDGYTFLMCIPWNFGSASSKAAWGVNGYGDYIYGTANTNVTNIKLAYIYVSSWMFE